MGAAASQEDEINIVPNQTSQNPHGERNVFSPEHSSSGSPTRQAHPSANRPASQISRQLSRSSLVRSDGSSSRPNLIRKNTISRFIEGYEEAEVFVSKSGFSMQNIQVMEGQTVKFRWDTDNSTPLNIVQVVHDGEKLRPVIGGFGCSQSQCDGLYQQQFNLEGDYKFAISGIRSTPLTILVRPRVDLQAEVTDDGFSPKVINIDKGHTVRWSWVQCTVPHSVQEVTFDIRKGGFNKKSASFNSNTLTATVTGSYRHSFKRSGLYYFQTDGMDLGDTHLCIVHVRETQREFKVEVLDRSFNPMVVLIEEGDRVWWHWDRFKCKKFHSIYQINPPKLGHTTSEPYEPIKDGFRWTTPSKQGLLSYQFHVPGVYFFSDQNFDEAAEYIGTVIVKPKQKEHYIELTENGFSPELWYAQTGDRIWWTWSGKHVDRINQTFTICEIDRTLNPATKLETPEENEQWQYMDPNAAKLCTRLGLATVQYSTVGVYHYRVSETPTAFSTCSIIVNPGPKNYTIHLTDNGFEPKVMTIRPNDRVWWVWQTGQKQHNVIQVCHQGTLIDGGFGSGAPRDCPSAYTYQFHDPGVFYFKSLNLPKMFGAVVVSTQPQVHEVQVLKNKLTPDPVVVKENDIVCWVFPGLRHHQLQQVTSVDQILSAGSSNAIAPRRCMSRAIKETGIFHFCSKSFQKKGKEKENNSDVRLSTVISDDRFDNAVIRVTKYGFYPPILYVRKGESVLWSWKLTEDPHNIIHVTAPDSQAPLNVVQGPKSFNSGKPVPSHSFLYTFDEVGAYTVASQGAPGCSCTIHVLQNPDRCHEPYVASHPNGGTIERYTTIHIACDTPGARVYYTTDGSRPELQSQSTHLYDDGVILNEPGLQFIRAIAVRDGLLYSHVMTSRRFWVLSEDTDPVKEAQVSSRAATLEQQGRQSAALDMTETWKWLSCVPTIKGCVTQPGEMEIYWQPPPSDSMALILGYQIFLNGISYCEIFPPQQNTINVAGLAGGRQYEIHVAVYPKSEKYTIQESNKLLLKCPLATHDHGPVISLETTNRPDTLAVVWMSIDTELDPITGYLLFLNDVQVGQTLVPDKDSNRCKVVVEGCDMDVLYKVVVFALPKVLEYYTTGGKPKTSNLLEVLLPLKTEPIVLPPAHRRIDDEDIYREFLEIREGSGYLPAMDEVDNLVDESEATQTVARRQPKAFYLVLWDGREVTSEDFNKGTQTPWRGKAILDPAEAAKIKARAHKGAHSDSSDFESGSEDEGDDGVCTIDIARPVETKVMSGREQSGVPRKMNGPVEIDVGRDDESTTAAVLTQAIVHAPQSKDQAKGAAGKPRRLKQRRKRPKSAVIDVRDADDFNVDQAIYEDGRKRLRVVRTPALRAAPPGERLPRPDLEGQFIVCDGDDILPAPSVMVESRGHNSLKVEWELPRQPDPEYRLLIYVVNVIGESFDSSVNSDISFDCNIEDDGRQVAAVQHCWNISGKHSCVVKGLMPNQRYRLYVVANYTQLHGPRPTEMQTTSSVLYYTTLGAPKPPSIKVVSVDLYQACLEWQLTEVHEDYRVKGFRIFINRQPHPDLQPRRIRQLLINHMIPGDTLEIAVMAVSRHAGYNSDLSRSVRVTCPKRPPAPVINQQPSYKKGCVLVAWDKPHGYRQTARDDDISLYCVYTDDSWYGEIRANASSDKQGYQFFLTDLTPAQSYDVTVKTICGPRRVDSKADHVFCLSDSPFSNVVPVTAPAAPHSPKLRIEGLHPDGIDVTWQMPQQYGEAGVSGFQMLKNGKLYGSVIPPDVNSLRIRDLTLGERLTLQVIALTDHPVGRADFLTDKDSGIDGSSHPEERELLVGEKYAGCKPGARLVVHYSGLVIPPSKVWAEEVTGHSALLVWKIDDHHKSHFVRAENYQVTWWPGDKPHDDINSDSTTADHLLITNLKPSTTYTVVVEARKMQRYDDMDEEDKKAGEDGLSAFILTSKSEQMTLKTASPPNPVTHLGVIATTCNSLKLAWNPPQEHGVEVIAIRVDCTPAKSHDVEEHVSLDLMPDATSAVIEGLAENTDYMICVSAITHEFFETLPEKHRLKKLHALPKDARVGPDDSPWLPCATIVGTTSGTDKPSNLQVLKSSTTSLQVSWTPAVAYGTNKLMGTIVRWVDRQTAKSKDDDLVLASYVNLLPNENTLTIENLIPGTQYRVVVEAVVSLKTSLEPEKADGRNGENRRTAHVMSDPLYTRTRAPTEPPRLQLVGLNSDSCRLHWEKPILLTVVGKDDNDQPKYVRRYLEGYKVEINGRDHMTLGPSAQTCTLTRCKPGRTYNVVLVALSCTEDVKKERKRKSKSLYKKSGGQLGEFRLAPEDENELDHSPSEPLQVTLPKQQTGFLASLEGEFQRGDGNDSHLSGEINLKWTTYGETTNLLRQFNILWFSDDDHVIQTKYVPADQRGCTIPVTKNKVLYTVSVEPGFYKQTPGCAPQTLHIMTPGPPDPPEIILKSVDTEEFVVEWGEPRLYGGVKVRGYQVYLNDRKAGNELSSTHRKAIIPCRPNRHYKMQLVALSAHPDYADSFHSNSLHISSGPRSPRLGDATNTLTLEDWSSMADDQEIALKVASVSDTSIHLDWSTHLETDGVTCYKVQWSSVAQPDQREVKLDVSESSCVINKCLPGTTHFVRVISVSGDGNITGKSRQLTVQTSAPPDAPKLAVRACNFRYIAIQWEKPIVYGDAGISGYKVYINGVVEATLTPHQLSFTFTHGTWCQEYCFQVQAMCTVERLNSKISEPLIIAWPGVASPMLERIPTVSSRAVRVRWESPFCTEGVTVKHYKLLCVDANTGKTVQSLGPLHPNMKEAEVRGLQKSAYNLFLETHVHGTSEVVVSPGLSTQPATLPDPPQLTASVIGLEDRRQLNRVTSQLVNKRDRLIRKVGHQIKKIGIANHAKAKDKNQEILKTAQTLSTIEDLLESCFHGLSQYSGHVLVHLSWVCPQSSRDIEVTGYQVLVDGKHYGSQLAPGIRGVRVKLDLAEKSHTVSVLALTANQMASSESNIEEVLTEPFQPFSFYCYHDVHKKAASWPSSGCCRFDDSVKYERQLAKKLANQGLLKKQVPPPACSLMDVFDGEFKPLLTHNKLSHSTVMLFWTPWCLASRGVMNYFIKFAQDNSKRHNFIAIASNFDARQPRDRQQLIHTVTENGWRDDQALWHCTSHCASTVTSLPNNVRRTTLAKPGRDSSEDYNDEKCVDLTDLLGIAGVPTLLFIHQDGYIAWHGRYCANSYKEFNSFMKRTFEEVSGQRVTPDLSDDTHIDPHIYDILLKLEGSQDNPSTLKVGVTDDVTVTPMLLPHGEYPLFIDRQRPRSAHGNRPSNRKNLPGRRKSGKNKKKTLKGTSNTVLYSTM